MFYKLSLRIGSEKAIHTGDHEEFYQITVESIIEAFEVECSALLAYDNAKNRLTVEAAFGFEEPAAGYKLNTDGLGAKGRLKGKNAFIENIDPNTHPWAFLGLCQMILCPYENSSGDLRGITAITERLEPEQVVRMLNSYFEVMMAVIHQFDGTINEIIGDSLFTFFGAPQEIPDRAQRAVACAIAMQNAMSRVNQANRSSGLPELEMGIGLHDSEVVVGNIGSSKRSKYSVVGSGVNLVSRIESYTVGGQILVSESVYRETGDILRIDGQREVFPKGSEVPLKIYEIGGIAGSYNLALEEKGLDPVVLAQRVPLQYTILEGKHAGVKNLEGFVVRLSKKGAEIVLDEPVEQFSDLKMNLKDVYEELSVKAFYGKVIDRSGTNGYTYRIRFTSVPLEVAAYFLAHQQYAAKHRKLENR